MCLKKEEYKKIIDISSEDDRINRYLKGETLEVDDLADKKAKGWYLVCVDGYPLGWGKIAGGISLKTNIFRDGGFVNDQIG